MDKVLLVHVLEARDHLLTQHAGRFERKLAVAVLEQILERLAQQLHDQCLVVTLNAIPEHLWDASYTQSMVKHQLLRWVVGLLPPCKTLYSFISYSS